VRIGVLGSGTVGTTLAAAWAGAGHAVRLGSGHPQRAQLQEWSAASSVPVATFAEALEGCEAAVNGVAGAAAVDVLSPLAGALDGRVLVDVSNPLDFSAGFPPSLSVMNTESLAERVQRCAPGARVVKALNTVTAAVMVAPAALSARTHLPIAGDNRAAKDVVVSLLADLGWREEDVLDLGPLEAARGMEAYLLLWVRLLGHQKSPMFNMKVVGAA
jgi:predicted dinucleotide-binding enzyme